MRVADGTPSAQANRMGASLRRKLNAMFAEHNWPMCAYGDYSFAHLIFDYHGPRPTSDEFIPYDGSLEQLDPPQEPVDLRAFRAAMILNGVDLPGRGMF